MFFIPVQPRSPQPSHPCTQCPVSSLSANPALPLPSAAPKPLEFLRTPFGGRLLVLDSFLYKQEKAMGDKVYWKCREHTELGCRGRAITRGGRATVMRGHCHAPDEKSLEARRLKQKLLRPPEGPGDPQAPGGQGEEPLTEPGPVPTPEEPEEPDPEPYFLNRSVTLLTLPLRSLPLKKRRLLMIGECLPAPTPLWDRHAPGPFLCPNRNVRSYTLIERVPS